jgi:uncharacterized protein YbaR (Trm112 family)
MAKFRARALRWHSDDFPGWLEVAVRDASGREHRIIEKAPVILPDGVDILPNSSFPVEFWIEAGAEPRGGREVVVTLPRSMGTTENKTQLTLSYLDVDREHFDVHLYCPRCGAQMDMDDGWLVCRRGDMWVSPRMREMIVEVAANPPELRRRVSRASTGTLCCPADGTELVSDSEHQWCPLCGRSLLKEMVYPLFETEIHKRL